MKTNIDNVELAYNVCISSGNINEKKIDSERVKSLKDSAEKGIEAIKIRLKEIPKDSTEWASVFKCYSESLNSLIEAFLLSEGVEVDSVQCRNSYICVKHPELGLDWEFLETIRLKQNPSMKYDEWNILKMQFELSIAMLRNYLSSHSTSSSSN